MDNSNPPRTGGQPRTVRGAQSRTRPDGRGPLGRGCAAPSRRTSWAGPASRAPGLAVLRTLLDDFCWGKPVCWPGNARIASAAGLSVSTVKRCPPRPGGPRHHPHRRRRRSPPHRPRRPSPRRPRSSMGRATAGDGPSRPPGSGRPAPRLILTGRGSDWPRSVDSFNRRGRNSPRPPSGGGGDFPRGIERSNEPDARRASRMPSPHRSPLPPAPPRRRAFADWSSAPADDPVIAAELARRAEARRSAAAMPTAAELLDAVLGIAGTPQDGRGEAGEPAEVSAVEAAPAGAVRGVGAGRGRRSWSNAR